MSIRERLRADLPSAMRDGDQLRVLTIRALLATIDNAGAVEVTDTGYEVRVGLGHDVERRHVGNDEMRYLIAVEHEDLVDAARQYESLGEQEKAAQFAHRAEIAAAYLD